MRCFAFVAVAVAVLPSAFSMPALFKRSDTPLSDKDNKFERAAGDTITASGHVTTTGGNNCLTSIISVNAYSKIACSFGQPTDGSKTDPNTSVDPLENQIPGAESSQNGDQLQNVNPFANGNPRQNGNQLQSMDPFDFLSSLGGQGEDQSNGGDQGSRGFEGRGGSRVNGGTGRGSGDRLGRLGKFFPTGRSSNMFGPQMSQMPGAFRMNRDLGLKEAKEDKKIDA